MSGRRPPREPNVGIGGNVLLVSMRDIAAGEELTIDYALFLGGCWLRHGMTVRNRGLSRRGDGNGRDAHRPAGALPGMVSGGSTRRSPKPRTIRPDSPDGQRRTGHSARSAADDSRSGAPCGIGDLALP